MEKWVIYLSGYIRQAITITQVKNTLFVSDSLFWLGQCAMQDKLSSLIRGPKVKKDVLLWLRKSKFLNQNTQKHPQRAYPFKTAPRWLSCKHLNDRATKAPNINSKIITCTFVKCGPNNLQHKNVLVLLRMLIPLVWNKQVIYSNKKKITATSKVTSLNCYERSSWYLLWKLIQKTSIHSTNTLDDWMDS